MQRANMVQTNGLQQGMGETLTRYPADYFGVKPSERGLPTGISRWWTGCWRTSHSVKDSFLLDDSSAKEKPGVTGVGFPSMSRGRRDPKMLIRITLTDHEGRKCKNLQCEGPKISARTKWTLCCCCQRAGTSAARGHCCGADRLQSQSASGKSWLQMGQPPKSPMLGQAFCLTCQETWRISREEVLL